MLLGLEHNRFLGRASMLIPVNRAKYKFLSFVIIYALVVAPLVDLFIRKKILFFVGKEIGYFF